MVQTVGMPLLSLYLTRAQGPAADAHDNIQSLLRGAPAHVDRGLTHLQPATIRRVRPRSAGGGL